MDWPIFYTAFTDSISVYNYTNFENNQRLNKCLKRGAKHVVKSLLIHPDNVNSVLEQLRFRFSRPEILIRCQLELEQDVQPISEETISKIIRTSRCSSNL